MIKGTIWHIKHIFIFLFRRFILIPIAFLMPKKPNSIVFIGSFGGEFVDNVKYLFLYFNGLKKNNLEIYFLTENKKIFNELKEENLPVVLYPTWSSILKLLRTGIVVVDNWMWYTGFRWCFLYRSYKVQLWHGIGLKKLEFGRPCDIECMKSFKWQLEYDGRYPAYDLLISTSDFFSRNFLSKFFIFKNMLESGYPRNDIFYTKVDNFILLGVDRRCFERVICLKKEGCKVVLYAPTYRESGRNPISDKILYIDKLSDFAKKYNLIFILKFHMWGNISDRSSNRNIEMMDNIINYDYTKDIYPLLPLTDLMISDYSSIYMDYLLLDKPIIFFPYDYQKYIAEEGCMQFDYNWITPGPKCFTQFELEKEIIKHLIDGRDEFRKKRRAMQDIAFKSKDGKASERIFRFIDENCLK